MAITGNTVQTISEKRREVFWSRAHPEPNTGCWLWAGGLSSRGRAMFSISGSKNCFASRLAYMLARGPIADGLCVCHTCDVPLCVNPDHLFLGTQQENLADMRSKGRSGIHPWKNLTHCRRGHLRTPENIRVIRGRWSRCKLCSRITDAAYLRRRAQRSA